MDLALRRVSLLLFVAALSPNVRAQVSESAAQIMGRVARADTGAPIEGAKINLLPPIYEGNGSFQNAKTDGNGEYRFVGVVSGAYEIDCSAEGFVSQAYRPENAAIGGFERIDDSTRLREIDFRLLPEAAIHGTVAETDGKPVGAGVSVAAVRVEKREDGS
jgi:Carboxypeptidase regulatory-like domain